MELGRYHFDKQEQQQVEDAIRNQGFAVVNGVYSTEEMQGVEEALKIAVAKEAEFHGTTNYKDYGMLLACPIYGGPFIEIMDNPDLWRPFNAILGDSCITYVYTSSCMPPKGSNYSGRIHVDRPHFNPNQIESLGCLICVNDFTKENGGTWVLPFSHNQAEEPLEEYFYKHAIQIEAKAGSVFYFSLRLWHAGGFNASDQWRNSLGIGMIKPYFKQRIDLPRAIPERFTTQMSDLVKQKLGYFAQPPKSLDEFYAPLEQRTYKEKSEWDK